MRKILCKHIEVTVPSVPMEDLRCGTLIGVRETPYTLVLAYNRDPCLPHRLQEKPVPLNLLACTTAGAWRYDGRRGSANVDANSIVAANAGTRYGCGHDRGSRDQNLILCLRDDGLRPDDGQPLFRDDILPAQPNLQYLLDCAARPHISDERLDAIAAEAFQLASALSRRESITQVRKRTDLVMLRAKRFIQDRYASPLTLRDMAGHVGLSPYWFLNRFKQCHGIAPYAYLMQVRVARAKDLLRYSATAITEIALQTGFKDLPQFSRAFHAMQGESPTTFRRNYRSTS